ncbi:uncharacterized protein [Littorina saxatilis]|uniref:uncharacterized protein isoform X2 n=1 Tax=Littorina saxatilis TaxID=31220 RepID=UPI0038B49D36
MAFERWQQQLCDLLKAVQTKRNQYDQASRACQILLQPWPKQSEHRGAGGKNAENKNGNAQENPADPHEDAELKFVNDVLSKAQKTRVKLSSKIPKDDLGITDVELATGKGKKQLWEICKPEDTQKPEKKPDAELKDNLKAVPVIQAAEPLQQNSWTACSRNSSHTQHKKPHGRPGPSKETVRPGSAKGSGTGNKVHSTLSSATKPTLVTDSNSIESARSVQSQTRPKSGQGKVKPAHMTAPFQTNPNLHAPRRQGRGTVPAAKQRHPTKNHIHSAVGRHKNSVQGGNARGQMKVLPPIFPEMSQSVSSSPDVHLQDFCDTPVSTTNEHAETTPSNNEHYGNKDDSSSFQPSSREPPSTEMSKLNLLSNSVNGEIGKESGDTRSTHLQDLHKTTDKQDAQRFSLLSQGASLTIPAKVRRAFAKNQQLKNKMLQNGEQKKTKSKGHNMGQEFADKLQQLFDTEEEVVYRQQTLECLYMHQRLADVLKQLDLDGVTELSSPYDVLRAKALTEFVLSSFSMYAEDANMLSKVFCNTSSSRADKQFGKTWSALVTSVW